jgi:putative DNA primase/helicase
MTALNRNGCGVATSILDAALSYAGMGIPVFPCDPHDKSPLTVNGFKDAVCDPAQVHDWWTRHPNAMIGMPTGEQAGCWGSDIDLDQTKGINGYVIVSGLIASYGELPKTLTSITPRGGRHLFWQQPPGFTLRNSQGFVDPASGARISGIDTRANGGYVILPPSVRADGQAYRWDPDGGDEPAEAPHWLIALLSPQKPTTGRRKAARKGARRDEAWAQAALDRECAQIAAAPPGTRNAALNLGAYSVFQIVWGTPGILDEGEVRQRLFTAAVACGLVADDGDEQCWRTIESGAEGARSQPRVRDPSRGRAHWRCWIDRQAQAPASVWRPQAQASEPMRPLPRRPACGG